VSHARRQYDAVDPENRLVAGELERRWNEALEQSLELESRLTELERRHSPLTDADIQRLLELGSDLKKLWTHPSVTTDLKKRVLRTVLNENVIVAHDDPPRNELLLHWQGGVHTKLSVPRNPRGKHGRATSGEAIDVIRELSKVCDDREIARVLNRLGYRTGRDNSWQASRVADVRHHYRLPSGHPATDGQTQTTRDATRQIRALDHRTSRPGTT